MQKMGIPIVIWCDAVDRKGNAMRMEVESRKGQFSGLLEMLCLYTRAVVCVVSAQETRLTVASNLSVQLSAPDYYANVLLEVPYASEAVAIYGRIVDGSGLEREMEGVPVVLSLLQKDPLVAGAVRGYSNATSEYALRFEVIRDQAYEASLVVEYPGFEKMTRSVAIRTNGSLSLNESVTLRRVRVNSTVGGSLEDYSGQPIAGGELCLSAGDCVTTSAK